MASNSATARFRIQEHTIALPVEVREATMAAATYLVSATRAQSVIDYSGLTVRRVLPGKAVCALTFVRYIDGDLGPYHEFGVALMVTPPRGMPGRVGVFIHWLPVNGSFTLDAGRTIWGFPKQLAHIAIERDGAGNERCAVHDRSTLVAALSIRGGMRTPAAGAGVAFDAYTFLDGRLRRTAWSMAPARVRARPGGTHLYLGDHPVAEELRLVGLPKVPMLTSTVGSLRMEFGAAEDVGEDVAAAAVPHPPEGSTDR